MLKTVATSVSELAELILSSVADIQTSRAAITNTEKDVEQ